MTLRQYHDNGPDFGAVRQYLLELQDRLCTALELEDGQGRFVEDAWQHSSGGGGRTRVLNSGLVFEQAGVNYSYVKGDRLPAAATVKRPELEDQRFRAVGVSLVIHPLNPYVPTTHMNVRSFAAGDEGDDTWWFGGGFDLTPYYGFREDAVHWHRNARQACLAVGEDRYPRYKQWCDDYFYLRHRGETRGIGGLFFDDLNSPDFQTCFGFLRSVGDHFLSGYLPIVARRRSMDYGARHRDWQLYRRGRYVEFNLVYDRGTLFGLQSGGRTESILMSLPPKAVWRYNYQPEPGSPEADLYDNFLGSRNWLADES